MTGSRAAKLRLMRKEDWGIALAVIVLAPLWIAVAMLGGLWFLVASLFSRLRLPELIGVPLGLAWMALLVPVYPFLMIPAIAIGHLSRERIAVDDSTITIRRLFRTRQIQWSEITAFVEVFSPPFNRIEMRLRNGKVHALSPFAEIMPVLEAAGGHGVEVRRLKNAGRCDVIVPLPDDGE